MKWRCACGGQVRSSGDVPNPVEWLLISDVDFDHLRESSGKDDIYYGMSHMFRCETCGRLHVFWAGWDHPASVYLPDGFSAFPFPTD